MRPKQEESFGVIPLSKARKGWQVFLIQHKHGKYWGFPKGHAEPTETPQEAALRELKEETNLELIRYVVEEPLIEQYRFMWEGQRIFKRVYYYIAEVAGEVQLQKNEIQDGKWVPFAEAMDQVTHPEGKALVAEVAKILAKESA
ncbi:MAG: NUDIX domain-containing protein [Verrucomicrobiota bacterium]|nr:NUDIX domain-containing protein [Verrucomicrobiota bacterium]